MGSNMSSKPKTYLVPERERTEPPSRSITSFLRGVLAYSDRELIQKCGLDAYFFLRYLKTLLVIFIPICLIVLPVLIPINYIGGRGNNINPTDQEVAESQNTSSVIGLDTLAWKNVKATQTGRYSAHLLMALLVVIWVCTVFYFELKVYIKVRQDYLTTAEHRLRASATTVLVNSIPAKWLSVDALEGLFDVFPGGVRNVWLNRDLSALLDKIQLRDAIHQKLEDAETQLIKDAKKAQLKQQAADEKKRRKKLKLTAMSKKEKAEQDALKDAEAERMANVEGGMTSGDQHDIPHTLNDGVRESKRQSQGHQPSNSGGFKINILNPLTNISHGLKDMVDKADGRVDDTLGTTNGFVGLTATDNSTSQAYPRVSEQSADIPPLSATTIERPISGFSAESQKPIQSNDNSEPYHGVQGNRVRTIDDNDDMINQQEVKIWQFWKPPAGAYTSPVPQGVAAQEFMQNGGKNKKSAWQTIKSSLPFMGDEIEPLDYPPAVNPDYNEEKLGHAEWEKYLRKKDRPTHRLAPFNIMWLPGFPLFNKKVDTIDWCREELARLNVEIEEDQKQPERFPLMTSAFIQFNHQVAAHMACQSVVHHIPKQMAPRQVEISPHDVDWNNMAVTWWQEWIKSSGVFILIAGMIFLWAVPVAWTAALGQLDQLVRENHWLGWLEYNSVVKAVAKVIAGVLPAAVLGLLLFLIPVFLDFLAAFKGVKTGAGRAEFVQTFYFIFLFIQVFLIVSIASFFAASIGTLAKHLSALNTPQAVLDLLAQNLPSAANYFFSYMILQAMSVSSGTLLQIGTLFVWYILARIMDSTARAKWRRNTTLNDVNWGKFFPVYTNFAVIGLVYCVIAPLISIFAAITFSLLYFAHRYNMLYVTRFESDTGGVLYPRAINQTFTGLYVMELCMLGLFIIALDENGNHACTPHSIVMVIAIIFTIGYQILLNWAFSPLFRYLPITFEDEAVLRDEAFQRAQDRRFNRIKEEDEQEEGDGYEKSPHPGTDDGDDIELQKLSNNENEHQLRNPLKQVRNWAKDGGQHMGTWAKDGGKQLRRFDPRGGSENDIEHRRQQRQKDLESQRAIGEALYGGFNDEMEDLLPEDRDMLVRHAFQHAALRARRPVVWIPRDDLGISDDEIQRTKAYSEHIWISNEGTALDSKVRVVYGKSPPDFSEIDVIKL